MNQYNNFRIENMRKTFQFFVLCLCICIVCSKDNLITVTTDVPTPVVKDQFQNLTQFEKLTGDKFIQNLDEIDFQISSSLFVTKSKIDQDNLYNQQAYLPIDSSQANCKIYPTDINIQGLSFIPVAHVLVDTVLFPPQKMNENQTKIRGFSSFQQNFIKEFEITYHPNSKKLPQIKEIDSMRVFPQKGSLEESSALAHKPKLFVFQNALYVFNKYNAYLYTGGESEDKFTLVEGFNAPADTSADQKLVSVGKIDQTKFYVISNKKIDIYEIRSSEKQKISLLKTYDDLTMGSFTPIASYFDEKSNTFFLTTFGFVYTFQIGDIVDIPTIRILQTNGTCNYIHKFEQTLHLSCRYNSVSYIAEIYLEDPDNFKINRFYSDNELYGLSIIRKFGNGGMILIGDEQLRIQNYGVNKQIIKDLKKHQPYFNHEFPTGIDMIEIPSMNKHHQFHFLALYQTKIQLIKIIQQPPQLYCEPSPQEKPKTRYNILMKFNTTKCQQAQTDSMTNICTVSVPLQIQAVDKIFIKAASTGSLATATIIFAILIAVIAAVLSVKRWRGLDQKMDALTHQLQKIKRRGKNVPSKI